jgi:hypothetical protein
MVIIANPIYDVVFKYLMANLDVAKGVISAVIDEEIAVLDFKSQEHVHKLKKTGLTRIKTGDDIDVLEGGNKIEERSFFIECLTHDSYVIRIPLLHVELKTELERVLSVFQQENFIDDSFRLKRYEYEVSGELLALMLKQLQKAAGDSELHKQIEEEENALHEFEATQRGLMKNLERTRKEMAKLGEELTKKDEELDKKDRYIQELEEKLKKIDA